MSTELCIALTVLCFGAVSAGGGEPQIRLAWNGRKPGPDGVLIVHPGRPHGLAVAASARLAEGDALDVNVLKILPDGTEQTLAGRLTASAPAAFDLGPLTAPAVYEFDHGVVYRRGYRLAVTVRRGRKAVASWRFHQPLASRAAERFAPGDARRVVYTPGWKGRFQWTEALAMRPVLCLKLNAVVLTDQDKLAIEYGTRLKEPAGGVPSVLCVTDAKGKEMLRKDVTAKARPEPVRNKGIVPAWQKAEVDPRAWPAGDYRVALWPKIGGTVWQEGPAVAYRRRTPDPLAVRVSPYAPWTLRRDPTREAVTLADLQAAHTQWGRGTPDARHWSFAKRGNGVALLGTGDTEAPPVELRPGLRGCYAVFARPVRSCLVQARDDGLVRPVQPPRCAGTADTFVDAADLTDAPLRIYAGSVKGSGLESLRLVPVTAASVANFWKGVGETPIRLYGVNDWCCYFHRNTSHGVGGVTLTNRLAQDQFDTLIGGQAELGMRTIDWSIGRSWVEYHTKLKNATRFPCVPLDEAIKANKVAANYRERTVMQHKFRPLASVYGNRRRFGVEVWPWLSMQRHYGAKAYGGIFASQFYRTHPQWWRWPKAAKSPAQGAMCYYFPEVRRERVDILLEVAAMGADGILVGCCRQVPMLLYHREMTEAYRKKTGVDPLKIDAAAGKAYRDWIAWRAGFFTQVLRDLKKGLEPIRKQRGARIPIGVRIPSKGIFYNLAQGLDVETWCREKLVDHLQVEPLETCAGRGSHDIRPYVALGRLHGVTIVGGVGATWAWGEGAYVPGLRRALGLLRAGVDGIESYETELQANMTQGRWLFPLFGSRRRLEAFLASSNLEACFPVHSVNAPYGHDNHSFGRSGYDVHGFGNLSL